MLNFVYSIPQLFKFVPCPRHRLPTFDVQTGLLHPTPNWNLVRESISSDPCDWAPNLSPTKQDDSWRR